MNFISKYFFRKAQNDIRPKSRNTDKYETEKDFAELGLLSFYFDI